MTTAYTSLLGLALPVTGELTGSWGDTVNNFITQYLDAAIAGTQVLSTDADVTLTKTEGGSLNSTSAQYAILRLTGTRSAQRSVVAPAASKIYVVVNNTTGGYATVVRAPGPTTGVSIISGEVALVVWNGTDYAKYALPDGSITTAKIADANVTPGKLAAGSAVANIGYTPVQQGGGAGQTTNKLYIGWTGSSKLALQVDSTSFGTTWPIDISGTAAAATNATNATNATQATTALSLTGVNSLGANTIANPGYQKFPSGLTWAWGTVTLTPTGATNNSFYKVQGTGTFHPAVSYSTILNVVATPISSSGTGYYGAAVTVLSFTSTSLTLVGSNDYNSNTSLVAYYQILGL